MKTIIAMLIILPTLSFANKSNTGTSNGRFQLIQLSDMRADQYMIDTQTGKIWNRSCSIPSETMGGCEVGSWYPEDVVDITISKKEYNSFVAQIKKMKDVEAAAKSQGK
jgi:uncharacterized ParB-like nuclease family protein